MNICLAISPHSLPSLLCDSKSQLEIDTPLHASLANMNRIRKRKERERKLKKLRKRGKRNRESDPQSRRNEWFEG